MKKGGAPRTSTNEEQPLAEQSLKFSGTTKQRSGQQINFSQQATHVTAGNANSFVLGGAQTTKHEYVMRKNYVPSRNSNQNNGTVGNRTYNRLSQPPAQQLSTGGEFSRTSGKPRIDSRTTLGATTLGQKINATLEHQSGDAGLNPLQFQQKLGSVHMKGREGTNNINGQASFHGPKNLPTGGVGTDQGVRASLTLTERQTKNTISNQEYAENVAARGNQYATIQVGGVSKPQFNAKNGIEPITGPKAAQIQSFESSILPNTGERRSRRGGTRNINQGHSLDPNREFLLTSPRNSKSYLTQTSLTHGSRTVKVQKNLGQNGLQRRSIDQSIKGGLSKDYYSGKTPTQAFASTLQKVQQVGQFKKTATSRQGQRRSQIKAIVQEDAPYPPHTSSNNPDRSIKSKILSNQSMSLTRNTSQLRTSNLLGNDDSKKHTSSQTIQVEKSQDPVLPHQGNDSASNARKLSAHHKNKMNLHGMAKNKVNLQYQRREFSLGTSDKSAANTGALATTNGAADGEAVLSMKHRELMEVMSEQQNQLNAQTHPNRKVPAGDFDEQQSPDGANFSQVAAGRNGQQKTTNRITSEGPERKKPVHSAISMYSKTSSNLRASGFKQKSESQYARKEVTVSRSKLQDSPLTAVDDDYNTASNLMKTINNPVGKSLNTEDYKTSLKHQNSNKLIKSAAINPFFNKDVSKTNEQKEHRKSLGVSSLAGGSNKLTDRSAKDKLSASGIKVRPINSRISLSKTISTALNNNNNNNNNNNEPDQLLQQAKPPQQKQSVSNRPSNSYLTGGLSGIQNSEEGSIPQRTPATATCSKKQFEMIPSTGGSDEAMPKPHTSQQQPQQTTQGGSTEQTSQAALEKNKEKQEESAVGARRKSSNDVAPEFNVNFTVPKPKENPLKDYEKAKFASKTHGLITSYSANTHQGIQRNYNEDRVSIILNMTKPSSRKDVTIWPKCSYFAIYDGHGGSACADFLKDQLHLIIINQESFPKDPAQALTTGCLEAERRFIENADRQTPMHERSGSCGIVVLIVGKECYVANVGDSRAIMSADKGKKLFLLSRDHRPNEDYEVQRIVKNGGGIYQTQSIQNIQIPGEKKTQQQYILGPHRVIPGRLSVSRTFGDIEAKNPKYNGKEGVVIAQPEISQFTVRKDFHDFIVLGCDGIFDRLSNQRVLDACWDTINSIKSNEIKSGTFTQKTVHEVSGAMADEIIKQAAIERSMDNLTIVVVTFDNLQVFLQDRPKPTRLENHLFQIKEVESGATSTIVQPTPGLADSTLGGQIKDLATPQRLSGKRVGESERIEEVRTEDVETAANDTADTINAKRASNAVMSRTENTSKQGAAEKGTPSKPQETESSDRKNNSSSVVQSKRNRSIPLVTIKQGYITRNKKQQDDKELTMVELRAQNSEQPIDTKRRKAEILPKLSHTATHMTMTSIPESAQARVSKIQSPNVKGVKDQSLYLNQQFTSQIDSPKPLKKSQIATYRVSKTAKNHVEPLSVQLRNGTSPDGVISSGKQKGGAVKYSSAFSNTSQK